MSIKIFKLKWKDKWDSPRCESHPIIIINCCLRYFIIEFGSEDFWEQFLWLKYYDSKSKYPWYESDHVTNAWKKFWVLEVYNYLKYKVWKKD